MQRAPPETSAVRQPGGIQRDLQRAQAKRQRDPLRAVGARFDRFLSRVFPAPGRLAFIAPGQRRPAGVQHWPAGGVEIEAAAFIPLNVER